MRAGTTLRAAAPATVLACVGTGATCPTAWVPLENTNASATATAAHQTLACCRNISSSFVGLDAHVPLLGTGYKKTKRYLPSRTQCLEKITFSVKYYLVYY